MKSGHIARLASRLLEVRDSCRTFSTQCLRLQAAYPPPGSSPPSTPTPQPSTNTKPSATPPTSSKPPPYRSPLYNPPPSSSPSPPNPTPKRKSETFALAASITDEMDRRAAFTRVSQYDRKRAALLSLQNSTRSRALEKQISRRWQPGDVYAPHDLSPVEQQKWRKRRSGEKDVFDILGLDPLKEWKNVSIMAEYCTGMGRIRGRRDTGLRAVNQRKLAKAVRRGVGMGWMPSVHKHTEVLEMEAYERGFRRFLREGERR